MALLTLGLNHNTAPVALREKLAFPTKEAISTTLSDLRGHLKSLAPEAAILSTCNRTEIYTLSLHDALPICRHAMSNASIRPACLAAGRFQNMRPRWGD